MKNTTTTTTTTATEDDGELNTKPVRPTIGARREFVELSIFALPIIGAQLAAMGLGVADTYMAGRLSALDLAAVALGQNLFWPTQVIFWGLLLSVSPIISQLRGADRVREVGFVMRQAIWLALFSAAIVIFALWQAPTIYDWIGVDPEARQTAIAYLRAMSWGVPGFFLYFCLRYMVEGLGDTKPGMIVAMSALAAKIPLNYIFIYGKLGAPELGAVGCGVASAIVMWFEFLIMLWIALKKKFRICGWHERFDWPNFKALKRIIALGLPIGLTNFLEIGVFSLMALLIGRLGTNSIAAHQIAIIIAALAFMVALAIGQGTTIRVGFSVGARHLAQAKETAIVAISGTLCLSLVSAAVLFLSAERVVALFTEDAAVFALGVELLRLAAAFQLVDFAQVVAIGALRGYKATTFPMVANFIGYWMLALPIGYLLSHGLGSFAGVGAPGYWYSLILGLVVVAVMTGMRLWWLVHHPEQILKLAEKA